MDKSIGRRAYPVSRHATHGASGRRTRRIALAIVSLLFCACLERGKKHSPDEAPPVVPVAQPATSRPAVAAHAFRQREPVGQADPNAAIHLRLAAAPSHLNPMLAGDSIAVAITLGDVYEGLLQIERPGGPVQPGLAQSFEQRDEGKEWTFRLRKGVRFHDGTRLSTGDVLRSFALLKTAASPLRSDFDDLISLEAGDDETLVFTFRESRPARLEAFAAVPILSSAAFVGVDAAHLARSPGSRAANGTGPLRLVSWRDRDIHLERFAGYWGTASRAQDIYYHVIPDSEQALAALRSKRLHALLGLPIAFAIKAERDDQGLVLVRQSLPAYTAAVFNTERPTLGPAIRRALAHSFDRASIVRELFLGQVEIALGPFVHGSERADPAIGAPEFSLRPLRRVLGRNTTTKLESLALLVPDGSTTMQRLADIWAEDLRGLVQVTVRRQPFAELLTRVRAGSFDVALLSFSTSDAVDLFSLFHSQEINSGNLSRVRDPALDRLLAELRATSDSGEGVRMSRALHARLSELAVFAFLTTDARLGLIRPELGGVGDTASTWGARNMWLAK